MIRPDTPPGTPVIALDHFLNCILGLVAGHEYIVARIFPADEGDDLLVDVGLSETIKSSSFWPDISMFRYRLSPEAFEGVTNDTAHLDAPREKCGAATEFA